MQNFVLVKQKVYLANKSVDKFPAKGGRKEWVATAEKAVSFEGRR
jgi:hypothetical protein